MMKTSFKEKMNYNAVKIISYMQYRNNDYQAKILAIQVCFLWGVAQTPAAHVLRVKIQIELICFQ